MERKFSISNSLGQYASNFGIWFFLGIIVIVMSTASNAFLSTSNIINILRQAALIGIVAVGMTYVMIGGNFDLSVGATMSFAAVIAISMQPVDVSGTVLAIVWPLLAGAAVGAANGALVGYLKLNPFITTLGMQFVVLGTSQLYCGGQHLWVFGCHPVFEALGNGFIFSVPVSAVILITAVIVAQWALSYTNFGIYLKASGENAQAAKLSGAKVEKTIFISYLLVSICAAIAGVILASWVKNFDPSSGIGYEFEIITAVVLGGTSLLGGRGNVTNTFAGVLILIIIGNAMTLLNISYQYQLMVRGIIIITAVSLELIMKRKSRQ